MTPAIPADRTKASPAPVVTLTIVVLNLAVAFAVLVFPDLVPRLAFYASSPSPITAVTSLFLHTNPIHLLGNLVFIATVGPLVEFNRGRKRYVLIYFVTGLAGVLAHYLWSRSSGVDAGPLLGASAAVAGCFGYATVVFFGTRVPMAPKLAVPVWVVGLIWFAIQTAGVFVQIGGVQPASVAFAAHAAGFITGILFSLIFRVPAEQSLKLGHEVLDRLNSLEPHALIGAADRHLKRHPGDVEAILSKFEALEVLNQRAKAVELIRPLLSHDSLAVRATAVRYLGRIRQLEVISAIDRLKLAGALGELAPDASKLLAESVLNMGQGEPQRPNALFELALLLRDEDPLRCRELVAELENSFALHHVTALAHAKGLSS